MDLFYRVSVTSVRIPALRDRSGDVRELAQAFLQQLCEAHEVAEKTFDPAVLSRFEQYDWPGNVRELKNTVESLVLTVVGPVIEVSDLPEEFHFDAADIETAPAGDATSNLSGLARSEFEQICKVLRETSGNATLAAKQLGIAKSTLYLKLKKYSLDQSLDTWRSTN
jgi:DNA-binding NtrC family response regulator